MDIARVHGAARRRMEDTTPAVEAITAFGVPHCVVRTERAGSAGESVSLQGMPLGALLRTIVVRRGEDDYLFLLVPAGRRVDWPKLRALLGVSPMSVPDADQAQRVTWYPATPSPRSAPPLRGRSSWTTR